MTFSLLDWIICDKIIIDSTFNIGDIDEEQQMQLALNIFPGGESLLHKLAHGDKLNRLEQGDKQQAVHATEMIFTTAKKDFNFGLAGAEEGCSLEIPLVQDIYGMTAIDYCLGQERKHRKWCKGVFLPLEGGVKTINMAMATVIFNEI